MIAIYLVWLSPKMTQSGITTMVQSRYLLCLFAVGIALAGCQPANRTNGKIVTNASDSLKSADAETVGSKPFKNSAIVIADEIANVPSTDEAETDTQKTNLNETDANSAVTVAETDIVPAEQMVSNDEPVPAPILIPIKPPAGPRQLYPRLMLGKTSDHVNTVFGKPNVERVEGQAKILQYRGDACVVDFYLYPQDGEYTVLHWSWRHPIIGTDINPFACRAERANQL